MTRNDLSVAILQFDTSCTTDNGDVFVAKCFMSVLYQFSKAAQHTVELFDLHRLWSLDLLDVWYLLIKFIPALKLMLFYR